MARVIFSVAVDIDSCIGEERTNKAIGMFIHLVNDIDISGLVVNAMTVTYDSRTSRHGG